MLVVGSGKRANSAGPILPPVKLVVAIIHNEDAGALVDGLLEKEYRATRLHSSGGFLKQSNATIVLGVEDDQVDDVMAIIAEHCTSRTQVVNPMPPIMEPGEFFMPYPLEVEVGGATVFVLPVDRFERLLARRSAMGPEPWRRARHRRARLAHRRAARPRAGCCRSCPQFQGKAFAGRAIAYPIALRGRCPTLWGDVRPRPRSVPGRDRHPARVAVSHRHGRERVEPVRHDRLVGRRQSPRQLGARTRPRSCSSSAVDLRRPSSSRSAWRGRQPRRSSGSSASTSRSCRTRRRRRRPTPTPSVTSRSGSSGARSRPSRSRGGRREARVASP